MQKPSEFQGKSRCLDCLAHLQFIPAHAKAWFLLASADAPFQPRCARSKELLVPVAHPTGQFGWKLLSPSGWFFFNFNTCNILETAVKVGCTSFPRAMFIFSETNSHPTSPPQPMACQPVMASRQQNPGHKLMDSTSIPDSLALRATG